MGANDVYKPRLKEEDYYDYMAHLAELRKQEGTGRLTRHEYARAKSDLELSLGEKMDPSDRIFLSDINELYEKLLEFVPKDSADDAVKHEMEHAQKADELGYDVMYGIVFMRRDPDTPLERMVLAPFCAPVGPTPEDREAITKAPSELSEYDKM